MKQAHEEILRSFREDCDASPAVIRRPARRDRAARRL